MEHKTYTHLFTGETERRLVHMDGKPGGSAGMESGTYDEFEKTEKSENVETDVAEVASTRVDTIAKGLDEGGPEIPDPVTGEIVNEKADQKQLKQSLEEQQNAIRYKIDAKGKSEYMQLDNFNREYPEYTPDALVENKELLIAQQMHMRELEKVAAVTDDWGFLPGYGIEFGIGKPFMYKQDLQDSNKILAFAPPDDYQELDVSTGTWNREAEPDNMQVLNDAYKKLNKPNSGAEFFINMQLEQGLKAKDQAAIAKCAADARYWTPQNTPIFERLGYKKPVENVHTQPADIANETQSLPNAVEPNEESVIQNPQPAPTQSFASVTPETVPNVEQGVEVAESNTANNPTKKTAEKKATQPKNSVKETVTAVEQKVQPETLQQKEFLSKLAETFGTFIKQLTELFDSFIKAMKGEKVEDSKEKKNETLEDKKKRLTKEIKAVDGLINAAESEGRADDLETFEENKKQLKKELEEVNNKIDDKKKEEAENSEDAEKETNEDEYAETDEESNESTQQSSVDEEQSKENPPSLSETKNGLTEYLSRTEEFIRRRVSMYKAHVEDTQKDLDNLSYMNPFNISVRRQLRTQLKQEQEALQQSIDAFAKFDNVQLQVQSAIERSESAEHTKGQLSALLEGRNAVEALRNLISDPNYAQINEGLRDVDAFLAEAEKSILIHAGAVEFDLRQTLSDIQKYLTKLPEEASDVWTNDISPALEQLEKESNSYMDEVGEQVKDITKNVSVLAEGYAKNYRTEFWEALNNLEQSLLKAGVSQEVIDTFKKVLKEGPSLQI